MQKLTILLLALAALCMHCEAKVFTKCGLVKELRRQKFPEHQMRDWVCLIEKESDRDTSKVNNGYWGLFQIGQQYWCSTTNSPGKTCNVRCRELITDDITKASNCAKIIFNRQSFTAWTTWTKFCKGQRLPDISDCK